MKSAVQKSPNARPQKIPAGYQIMTGSYPSRPDVELFLLPDRRIAIINEAASPTANVIQLLFR